MKARHQMITAHVRFCVHGRTSLIGGLLGQVVTLTKWDTILPEKYPRFTLLCQGIAFIGLAMEALRHLVPEVCSSWSWMLC